METVFVTEETESAAVSVMTSSTSSAGGSYSTYDSAAFQASTAFREIPSRRPRDGCGGREHLRMLPEMPRDLDWPQGPPGVRDREVDATRPVRRRCDWDVVPLLKFLLGTARVPVASWSRPSLIPILPARARMSSAPAIIGIIPAGTQPLLDFRSPRRAARSVTEIHMIAIACAKFLRIQVRGLVPLEITSTIL